jgi:predicted  nucleic acid-binding Zn-ribbon protein
MATSRQKINHVETPIDNRETFTSLSKNLNESDSSMESKLRTLYNIQQTDIKIDKIHLLRGELPEEVRDLEDMIEGLKTRISNIKGEIQEIEKYISQKKLDIENCNSSIAKYEDQRSNVKNNREYDSLSKEIEFQGLEKELAEKRIRENTAALADKKAELEKATEELSGREVDLENKNAELVEIIAETSKEEEVLLKQRDELVSHVDERTMAAYDRMRAGARNHLAVVTVKRDACGGCFNKIPPQRKLDIAMSKKLIVCEYCGRIIVSSEFENE